MQLEPLKIIGLIIIIIGAITFTSTQFYGFVFYTESKARILLKYTHYSQEPSNNIFINEIILDNQDQDYPYRYFEMVHQSVQDKINEQPDFKKDNYIPIMFVPGHNGNYTQAIQLISQMHEVEKVSNVQLNDQYFKFFVLDFRSAPSLYSKHILEKQSDFLAKCYSYLKRQHIQNPQTNQHTKNIKIITHSMGGIVVLNTLTKFNKEQLTNLKEIMFLNCPLSQHPYAYQSKFSDFYQNVYNYYKNEDSKKKLSDINLISFSGGEEDFIALQHLTQFPQSFKYKYYHFYTTNIKEVYVNLQHDEILQYPPFLMQISKYLILESQKKILNMEIHLFFQDSQSKFDKLLFSTASASTAHNQHSKYYGPTFQSSLNLQSGNLTEPMYRKNCQVLQIGFPYIKTSNLEPTHDKKKYRCVQFEKKPGQEPDQEIEFIIETNIYPENMQIYVMIPQNQITSDQPSYYTHVIKPQFTSFFMNIYRFPMIKDNNYYMIYRPNLISDPRSKLYLTFTDKIVVDQIMINNSHQFKVQSIKEPTTYNYTDIFNYQQQPVEFNYIQDKYRQNQMEIHFPDLDQIVLAKAKFCSDVEVTSDSLDLIDRIALFNNLTVTVLQDKQSNQVLYTNFFQNINDCTRTSFQYTQQKNKKIQLYSQGNISHTNMVYDESGFFATVGRNQRYNIILSAFTYALISYLSLYKAHLNITDLDVQVIHPFKFLLQRIGKLILLQSVIMFITNPSFEIFMSTFLGIGLYSILLTCFEIFVQISRLLFSRIKIVIGLMIGIFCSFYTGKWLSLPILYAAVIGGFKQKSKNMANNTFFIGFLLYIFSQHYILLEIHESPYKEYIIDYNEGLYEYGVILVWLYYGYFIDTQGIKNITYIQFAIGFIIAVINIFSWESLHWIFTLIGPFTVVLGIKCFLDQLKVTLG